MALCFCVDGVMVRVGWSRAAALFVFVRWSKAVVARGTDKYAPTHAPQITGSSHAVTRSQAPMRGMQSVDD